MFCRLSSPVSGPTKLVVYSDLPKSPIGEAEFLEVGAQVLSCPRFAISKLGDKGMGTVHSE